MLWKCIFFCWLFVYMPGGLGPGSALGEKEEKITVGEKKFGELREWGGSLGRGKATRPLFVSAIFFLFDPILCLSPRLQNLVPSYMPGQNNDRQTESLTGQMVILAGHCLLTCRYFEPWTSQVIIWKAHLPERCKDNKFNAEKFSKWLYWFEFIMSSLVKQHQTIHCPLKPKYEFCISIKIFGCMLLNTS